MHSQSPYIKDKTSIFTNYDELGVLDSLEENENDSKVNLTAKSILKDMSVSQRKDFSDSEIEDAVNTYNASRIVSMMLNGMDPDLIRTKNGNTALMAAIANNDSLLVDKLLFHGADVNFKKDPSYLYIAIENGNYNITKSLIEAKANVMEIDDITGDNLLHLAIKQNMANTVPYLVECGALVNHQNKNGDTPLHSLVKQKQINIIYLDVLLKSGANPSLKNKHKKSPLQILEKHKVSKKDNLNIDVERLISEMQKYLLILDYQEISVNRVENKL